MTAFDAKPSFGARLSGKLFREKLVHQVRRERVLASSGVSILAVALLFILLLAARASSSAAERDPLGEAKGTVTLQPYVRCDGFAGGVRGVILDRRPQTAEPWREVHIGKRTQRVSVMDGYRVMYSYARTFPFANLKAERSDPWRYVEDKRIVASNVAEMAKADDSLDLVTFFYRGFSVQTLTKRELAGRALAMVQTVGRRLGHRHDLFPESVSRASQIPDLWGVHFPAGCFHSRLYRLRRKEKARFERLRAQSQQLQEALMRNLTLLMLLTYATMLAACSTMEGLGQDISKLGNKIEKKAEEKKN
jgi:predicted small secreted protein